MILVKCMLGFDVILSVISSKKCPGPVIRRVISVHKGQSSVMLQLMVKFCPTERNTTIESLFPDCNCGTPKCYNYLQQSKSRHLNNPNNLHNITDKLNDAVSEPRTLTATTE